MNVEVDGDIGTIVGMNSSANLNVKFANQLLYWTQAELSPDVGHQLLQREREGDW
jgi:mevalonate kinase